VLRPPIAQDRLTRTADGLMLLTLKTEWSDGTTALLFESIELLERLAALTPRPRINLVLHHGVLAPHSRWRARAVAYGRDTPAPLGPEAPVACGTAASPITPSALGSAGGLEASRAPQLLDPVVTIGGHQSAPVSSRPAASRDPATTVGVEEPPSPAPHRWSWPDLMRHTFAVEMQSAGLSPRFIQHIASVAQDYQDAIFAGTNDVIEMVTGKPPMTLEEFVERNRAKFAV
jgi:hypothetical protein